jgi:drug/metabolite transporter (DMT)-like permease
MKVLLEYFGPIVFGFVVLVGGLVALPKAVPGAPQTSPSEIAGLVLAGVVIAGGFSWYYFAASIPPAGRSAEEPGDRYRGPQ